MRSKLLQQIRGLFRKKPREFIYEPVVHRLNPSPILPQGMMEAIAPAYEEALSKEKEEKEEKPSLEPQKLIFR